MDLDPRRLRAFMTVAEELHFSRAAVTLHVSQPALSQQIRALERDLEVQLFVRTSQRVELTPAGESLQRLAPRVLAEQHRAIEETRHAATGVTGLLRIWSVRTGLSSVVPELMRAHTRVNPRLRYELAQADTALQLRALADRTIDVGIVRAAARTPGLVIEPLASEPLRVAVPENHPLAWESVVDPASLADEGFVMWPRRLGADFFDLTMTFLRSHGVSPRVISEADDVDSQLALVAAGFGISLQPAYYAGAAPAGVVFRPLAGPPPRVELQLAWRRHGSSAATVSFVETARSIQSLRTDQATPGADARDGTAPPRSGDRPS